MPAPTRSARSVSIVTSSTFGRGAGPRARQHVPTEANAAQVNATTRGTPRRRMRSILARAERVHRIHGSGAASPLLQRVAQRLEEDLRRFDDAVERDALGVAVHR